MSNATITEEKAQATKNGGVGHPVVTREAWLRAREELLVEEKKLTRQGDAVSAMRRALPWVKLDREYRFDGPDGPRTLADLFDGRSQLVVYHFMLGPGWKEGCSGCSHVADHVDGARPHLGPRDVAFVAVSRAPWAEIEPFQRRMGWQFPWVSSAGSTFNYDFGVAFTPEQLASGDAVYNYAPLPPDGGMEDLSGVSVFYRDAETGDIYHTYSAYARGLDILLGSHHFLDLTPKGRNETDENGKHRLRHHDRY